MPPRPRSFFRFVLIGLVFPCLLLPIVICYQALKITGKPQVCFACHDLGDRSQ